METLTNVFKNLLDIGELILGDFIDKGSSGEVYKSTYKNKNVISKCFKIDNYKNQSSWINDIYGELDIYKKLGNTKGSCKCIGYCFDDKCLYLILKDYETKMNLYDYLNHDNHWKKYNRIVLDDEYYYKYKRKEWIYKLDRNSKIDLTKKIIDIIYELHKKNIVHCDLKTNNILYNDKVKELTLIDFGASYFLSTNKEKDTYRDMGTMGYACIILNDEGICCKKSDIYSLGVCITEIWCGAIWNTGITHGECRLEVLSSLRKIKGKEPLLEKEIRKCVSLTIEKRPLIVKLRKNILNIF